MFNKKSLKGFLLKSILITLIFSSLTMIILVIVFTFSFREKEIERVKEEHNISSIGISTVLRNASNLYYQTIKQSNIFDTLSSQTYSYEEKITFLNKELNKYSFSTYGIQSIRLVSKELIYRYGLNNFIIEDPNPKFINLVANSINDLEVYQIVSNFLILGFNFRDDSFNESAYFYINISEFYNYINPKSGPTSILLFDDLVVYDSNVELIGKTFTEEMLKSLSKNTFSDFFTFNNKIIIESNLLEHDRFSYLNVRLVEILTLKDTFMTVYVMYIFLIIILIFTVIYSIFLSFYLSSNLTKNVKRLINKLVKFGSDTKYVPNENEFDKLENAYDEMMGKIYSLIEESKIDEENKRKLELDALQAQVNPHFLYNTLDAIAWMAKIKKEHEIEKLVISLARFFRISLHKGDKYILVSEEVQLINHFLDIELIRFPNKFVVSYNISDNVRDLMTLKLILQPIVENAIKHGISVLENIGHLTINAYLDSNNDLIFEIIDDGVGFDLDIENQRKDKLSGFGISNVDKRIKLEFGENYGVFIHSEKGKGTKVLIRTKGI
jgi:two-component system sensor histidine kinase YesM